MCSSDLRRGDRLATLTGTSPDHVATLFACARLGVCLQPVSWRLAAPEIAYQLEDAEPSLVLAAAEHEELARAAGVAVEVEVARIGDPTLEPAVALRRFVENALAPATPVERPELVDRIMEYRLATAQEQAAWAAQAAAGVGFDRYDRVGEIAAATLVLTGTEDGVVDPRNADLLAEHVTHARLERFEGTGHLFFWEEPEAFVASVTRFLEDRPS